MFNLFKFFNKKSDEKYGKGWLIDLPDPEKAYQAKEIFSVFPTPMWKDKPQSEWKKFIPVKNQNGSNGCVSFTTALMLGVENFLEEQKFVALSPRGIYARKFVSPDGGMYYSDGLTLGSEIGAPPEVLLPADNKNEAGMRDLSDEKESDRIVAKTYRGGSFIYLPKDIDSIAGLISTGKAVALGTRFNSGGFSNGVVTLTENGTYGHAITGVDYTLWQGEKAIIFQNSWGDSWGFGGLGVLTETQLKGGGFILSAYYQDLQNKPMTGEKPKLKITAPLLKVGNSGNEVTKLQVMLQYLGYFPINQECTGYYGGITRQAVKDYETKSGLPADGTADADVIKKLNDYFK